MSKSPIHTIQGETATGPCYSPCDISGARTANDSGNHADNKNGPAGIVFFSGGTALNEMARSLAVRSRSTHILTTFDSGGSSAVLRKHMIIPAVGDIRARLLALVPEGNVQVLALARVLNYRLPFEAEEQALLKELCAFMDATHPALEPLLHEWRTGCDFLTDTLGSFMAAASDFDYRGASLGNLVIAALYLRHGSLQACISILGNLLQVQGSVLPVTEDLAHLAVALQSGQVLIGQHTFTGKWERQITAPIEDIWLMGGMDIGPPVTVKACSPVLEAIASATCLCYPIGSFFSSVAANLLVKGIGSGIAQASCPKIFIPNPGSDPELFGLTLFEQVEFLVRLLQRDAPQADVPDLLGSVLVDRRGRYAGGIPEAALARLGVRVHYASLLAAKQLRAGQLHIDGGFLAQKLLSIAD